MKLSPDAMATLAMFTPDTYCIDLTDKAVRDELGAAGLVEWRPAQKWSGRHTYGPTAAGLALAAKLRS